MRPIYSRTHFDEIDGFPYPSVAGPVDWDSPEWGNRVHLDSHGSWQESENGGDSDE